MDGQTRVGRSAVTYGIGLAVLAASITVVYLAMRDVMDIGGSCASGGPYVVANPCPEGTGVLMFGGIVGWFAGGGLALVGGAGLPGRYWTFGLLAWPALFLALGWNFLDYGRDSSVSGAESGYLVCAVVFFLMGGVPLVLGLKGLVRSLWPPDGDDTGPQRPWSGDALVGQINAVRSLRQIGRGQMMAPPPDAPPYVPPPSDAPPDGWRPPVASSTATAGGGIAAELERLAALRASGALDDDEFERAKDQILGERDRP